MKFLAPLFLLLASFVPAQAQTTTVTATNILDGSGKTLLQGQWCFNQTCLPVINGALSASTSVPSGTGNIAITNAQNTTYLVVGPVTLAAGGYSWDAFTLPAGLNASGPYQPYLPCAAGANYLDTQINIKWTCNASNTWQKAAAVIILPSGPNVGIGAPTAFCTAPCSYYRTDNNTTYAIVASAGTISNAWVLQSSSGGTVAPSATINTANAQVVADSAVTSTAFGYNAFGDSITESQGCSVLSKCYVYLIAKDLNIPNPINNGVSGDNAGDMTWHIFTSSNPTDSGNPIVTTAIGTNNSYVSPLPQPEYNRTLAAGHAWLALSSTDKILAGNAGVTTTGTLSTNTTFAFANGKTCTTGTCTLSFNAQVGTPGVFYVWYLMPASGGTLAVSVDGTTATDTVTNSASISTSYTQAPAHQAVTVGVARFAASNTLTASSHALVVTLSANATFLGFGFPPVLRYRGTNHPRVVMAGVPPQQNNANGAITASLNAANLGVSKLLVADGLDVPYADVFASMDPTCDLASTTTPQCPASAAPPLHPSDRGHRHEADGIEAAIGAVSSSANSNLAAPLNYAAVTPTATLPGTANGSANTTNYPSSGSAFPPTTTCLSAFSGYGWCDTVLNSSDGGFTRYITSNTGSGAFSVSFVNPGATPAQVDAGTKFKVTADGTAKATLFQELLFTPASSTATCTIGQFTDDANFHYVCTATNNWKRAALVAF